MTILERYPEYSYLGTKFNVMSAHDDTFLPNSSIRFPNQ